MLDGWKPRHWRLATPTAATWLVELFRLIEEGRPWPKDNRLAKGVFITKTTTTWGSPLAFRILIIVPVVYRT